MPDASLLPPNATTLERAAANLGQHISGIPVPLRALWSPADCPAALLPWLAYAYGVDEWDDDWNEDEKRAVIAASIPVKRTKGTFGAVQRAITAIGITADVQEWYQQIPQSAPYTFRLHISADQVGYTSAQLQRVWVLLARYKNLRSHCTGIDLSVRTTTRTRTANAPLLGSTLQISDGTPRYHDGISALDLLVDAVPDESRTLNACDMLHNIVQQGLPTLHI